MSLFKSVRSLTATLLTTPTGAAVAPNTIIGQVNVIYTDSAPGANVIAIQALLNDGVTWATIFTVSTTKASDLISLNGPYMDIRAAVTSHTVSGTITVDVFVSG